ncbi:MAG: hypothetical protein R6W75_00445 [Smithellaceae bacterium]
MTTLFLISAGAALGAMAMLLLFKDCFQGYGSTMGGEMFAGLLWIGAAVCLAAGVYSASGAAIIAAAVSFAVLLLIWAPCRWLVVRLGSKYGKPAPRKEASGFAGHIRRERELRKK